MHESDRSTTGLSPSMTPVESGIAEKLATHVTALAERIGERNVYRADQLAAAADYIEAQLRSRGFSPRSQEYEVQAPDSAAVRTRNIEVVIPAESANAPLLIVGAHYDSAPGTPGADDNATGVAALLELAAHFRNRKSRAELRFVAFSTEDPPFFGSPQMGSAHYARALAAEKRTVTGMISLEMLGYYSDAKGSQKYPPVLSWFYPDCGNYICFVSNISSRRFLRKLKEGYRPPRGTPLVAAFLPQWIEVITLSDQLAFWEAGWPAVMITDTAFLRNFHHHQPTDRSDLLDYERMADVVDGIEQSLLSLVKAE